MAYALVPAGSRSQRPRWTTVPSPLTTMMSPMRQLFLLLSSSVLHSSMVVSRGAARCTGPPERPGSSLKFFNPSWMSGGGVQSEITGRR